MKLIVTMAAALSMLSCTTLDQSVRLGGSLGAFAGGAATYAVQSSTGGTPPPENVWLGASIGMAVGLVTAYFTHQSVVKDRKDVYQNGIVEHGDLPPSPFIFPNGKKH
jgi:hypothetical protein